VELTNSTLAQVLLSAGNVMTSGQILDDLLSNPAALQQARLGIREAPFQVRYDAVVCRLLSEVGRIGEINLLIGAAYICAYQSIALQSVFVNYPVTHQRLALPCHLR
jgi:hypothetical protein